MGTAETIAPSEVAAQPDFRRLIRHIHRACGTFSMIFVIWDRADTEHLVYDAILASEPNANVDRLPLPSGDALDIFGQIEQAGSHRPDVLVVEGLHRAFPECVRASPDDRLPILQALNIYRERLRLHSRLR